MKTLKQIPRYIGSGQYCYANSLATVLGEKGHIADPGLLEALTGVSISAFWQEEDLPFFSSYVNPPDKGINTALSSLGYKFEHHYGQNGQESLQLLSQLLEKGSVLVGPVDMGELEYLPNRQFLGGVDHYITVFGIEEDAVFLHDPAGYPFMTLPLQTFMKAWKAETIGYRIGSFSMWEILGRAEEPKDEVLFSRTLDAIFRNLQAEKKLGSNLLTGADAIRKLAETIRTGQLSMDLRGHLSFFSFQLGARRCSDFSVFFKDFDSELAEMKQKQGQFFGHAHVAFIREDWESAFKWMMEIAAIEDVLQAGILKK